MKVVESSLQLTRCIHCCICFIHVLTTSLQGLFASQHYIHPPEIFCAGIAHWSHCNQSPCCWHTPKCQNGNTAFFIAELETVLCCECGVLSFNWIAAQILVDVGVSWSCSWGFRYFAIPPPGRCPCRYKNRCKRKWEACNDVEKWTWTCHSRGEWALLSRMPLCWLHPLNVLFHVIERSVFWDSSSEVLALHVVYVQACWVMIPASITNSKQLDAPGGCDIREGFVLRLRWYKATRNTVIWTL